MAAQKGQKMRKFGKNPFMSLWLSGANKVAGAARGHFLAEARRQQAEMTRAGSKAVVDFWSEALKPRSERKPRKKRK
jgi:hypothetical protein